MNYRFKKTESEWQQFWAENKTFKAENHSTKPKYNVLDMFPYPSGAGLHVDHPLGYNCLGYFCALKRLKGFRQNPSTLIQKFEVEGNYAVKAVSDEDVLNFSAEEYAPFTGQKKQEELLKMFLRLCLKHGQIDPELRV